MKKFMMIAALVLAAVFGTCFGEVPMADEAMCYYTMATNKIEVAKKTLKWSTRREMKAEANKAKDFAEGLKQADMDWVTATNMCKVVSFRRSRGEKLYFHSSHVLWEPASEKIQRRAINNAMGVGISTMEKGPERADASIEYLTQKFKWK